MLDASDATLLIGAVLMVTGVALWNVPAALVLLGLLLTAGALYTGKRKP